MSTTECTEAIEGYNKGRARDCSGTQFPHNFFNIFAIFVNIIGVVGEFQKGIEQIGMGRPSIISGILQLTSHSTRGVGVLVRGVTFGWCLRVGVCGGVRRRGAVVVGWRGWRGWRWGVVLMLDRLRLGFRFRFMLEARFMLVSVDLTVVGEGESPLRIE